MQVPKKAPVASPWMARATSRPPRSRLGDQERLRHRQGRDAPRAARALRPIRSESWPEGEHRGHERDHVAAEEERDDGVAEAEALLVERDERRDQAGAEREEHEHRTRCARPGSRAHQHAGSSKPPALARRPPGAGRAPARRATSAAASAGRRCPTARAPRAAGRAGGRGAPPWAGRGGWPAPRARRCRRRTRPSSRRPAHRHRTRRTGGREARERRAWSTAAGSTSTASTGPRPRRGPGLGQQARAAAGVERRPGGRAPSSASRHMRGGGVVARAEALARRPGPARAPRPGRPGGRGRAGTSPASQAAGGSGQPGTSARGRCGEGAGGQAPGAASSGAPRGAQTSPAASQAHRLQRAQRGEGPRQVRAGGPPTSEARRQHGGLARLRPSCAARRAHPARGRRRRASPGWPPSPSTSAWRARAAQRAGARRAPARPSSTRRWPRPASRGASPGASWPRRSALLDALPALAEAIRPRAGAGGLGGHDARVGALRGGARLARGQLAGLGADAGRRLGAGGRQRRGGAALLARTRRTTGLRARGPGRARGPRTRWVGSTCRGPEAEPLVWDPGVHAVVAHASTRTCKRQLAGLGRGLRRRRPASALHPRGLGQRRDDRAGGRRPRRRRGAAALGGFANGGPALHGGQAHDRRARRSGRASRPRLARGGRRRCALGDPDDPATDVAPLRRGAAPAPEARAALAEALALRRRGGGGRGRARALLHPDGGAPAARPPRAAGALARGELRPAARPGGGRRRRGGPGARQRQPLRASGAAVFGAGRGRSVVPGLRAARVLVDEGPLYQDPHLVVGGVGDSGLGGARPKLEQLVWARRVHRAGGVRLGQDAQVLPVHEGLEPGPAELGARPPSRASRRRGRRAPPRASR